MDKEIWDKAKMLAENIKAADAVINMEGILFEFGIECKNNGFKEAVAKCLDALPLRSDWDDDVKVTGKMVIDTARENINELLPYKKNIDIF